MGGRRYSSEEFPTQKTTDNAPDAATHAKLSLSTSVPALPGTPSIPQRRLHPSLQCHPCSESCPKSTDSLYIAWFLRLPRLRGVSKREKDLVCHVTFSMY